MKLLGAIAGAWGLLAFAASVAAAEGDATPRVLGLAEAVATALEHQPSVLVARAQTEAAEGRITQARSGYLPQVTGTVVYQRVHGTPSSRAATSGIAVGAVPASAASSAATYNLFSAGINATQLIWDFGQTIGRTNAAAAARDAQRASEITTRQQVVLQVRRAFFQAYAQKALIVVGKESVGNQERHLAQIQGFVGQGIRPEIDLAQARTDLANSRVTLINAETGYKTARAQLNQAMGVERPLSFDVSDEELAAPVEEEQPIARLVAIAMEARPELHALELQREASERTLSAIRGAYGPTLSATAGVAEAGTYLDTLGTNWNVGANLTWPLFQGGLTSGQTHEARANLDAVTGQIASQKLAIRVDIEQAVLAIQSAKVVIVAAKDAVDNARERLRLAEGRYESGVGSIIELNDAQLAVLNAGAQRVQADFSLALARADLLAALGK